MAPVVSVQDEAADPPDGGPGVLFVAVTRRRATLLESWFKGARERGAQLVPEEVVLPAGQTPEQRQAEDEADMSQSQRVAAAVAMKALGKNVEVTQDGARVETVVADSPAAAAGLLPGDVIVEALGEPVDGVGELRDALADVTPGDKVALKVRRGVDEAAKTQDLQTGTQANPKDQRAVMGVAVEDDAEIALPGQGRVARRSRSAGPSAGLPFALEVGNALSDPLAGARPPDRRDRAPSTSTATSAVGAAERKRRSGPRGQARTHLPGAAATFDAAPHLRPEGLANRPMRTFDEALAAIRDTAPLDDNHSSSEVNIVAGSFSLQARPRGSGNCSAAGADPGSDRARCD